MPSLSELAIDDEARFISKEFDIEKLRRPLLERAGVIDINQAFNELADSWTDDPLNPDTRINSIDLQLIIEGMRDQVADKLKVNEVRVRDFAHTHEHYLYPLTEEGLINRISQTELFKRQFGIPQLGLMENFPLPNSHTRGEHAVYTTINMVRTFQTLYDQDSNLFVDRLRSDFANESFYNEAMTSEEVLNLAVDLAVVTGMEHDQATPAGGDTMKYLVGMDEEEDLEWLFFGNHSVLANERAEFLEVLTNQGLNIDHLRFVINCIQGKSFSLIGDLIHPIHGDILDWDRIAYTLLDSQAATVLCHEIPTKLLPSNLTAYQTEVLWTALNGMIDVLQNPKIVAAFGVPINDRVHNKPHVPQSTLAIDPSEDFRLDSNGELVNTKPEKLAWVAALRVHSTALHYAGGKLLGVETLLQRRLQKLLDQGIGTDLLTRERLLEMTSAQLFKALKGLEDEELSTILEENSRVLSKNIFSSKIVSKDSDTSRAWATYPLNVKPGLDTKVEVNGQLMTLGEYVNENPTHVPNMLIINGMSRYSGKKVIIQFS